MAATVLDGIDAVRAATGTHLGYSEWLEVTRDRVEAFVEATGAPVTGAPVVGAPVVGAPDPADRERVAPYLVLALSNMFLPQIVEVRGVSVGVNYGCDLIRFPVPVPVGGRIRAGAELTAVVDIAAGVQTTTTIRIELAGAPEPACVIESVSRYLL